MIISVVNHSSKTDGEVREAIRAVNRQIERDFEPHWDLGASVHLAATASRIRATGRDRVAVVHLRKSWNEDEHLPTPVGAATGWVFTAIGPETEATVPWLHWTVALSHEILELVADPDLNTLIKGPHPAAKREVFHYREVCDPVQANMYQIDGVLLSNFVLPHYYNGEGEAGGDNDFLGWRSKRLGRTAPKLPALKAFRWRHHGEIGFWDPTLHRTNRYVTFPLSDPDDPPDKARKVKGETGRLRRYARPR